MPHSPDPARAENGLRTPEQQLRLQAELLELAHDAVIVRDPSSSRVTFRNRQAQSIYGYGRDEPLGRVTHELLQTVFPESFEVLDEALVREGLWAGDLRHRCRDGRVIVVSSRQSLQRDEDGRPAAIIELNSDITARKRTEGEIRTLNGELEQRVIARTRQLQRLNAELEDAQRLAGVGSWSWDRQSDEKVWSAQMYALLGRDPRSAPARRDEFLAYVHPADRDRASESYARMAKGGPSFELEYRIVDDTGAERRIHALGQQDAERPRHLSRHGTTRSSSGVPTSLRACGSRPPGAMRPGSSWRWPTTASASRGATTSASFACSSGCTGAQSSTAPASGWRSVAGSSINTGEPSAPTASRGGARAHGHAAAAGGGLGVVVPGRVR